MTEPDRPQMTILRRMRIAYWIPKATNTHTHTHLEYVIPVAFPRKKWLRERASILPYTHIACLLQTDLISTGFVCRDENSIVCYN
jgi:hypothetical protein